MPVTSSIKILKGTTIKMLINWEYPSDPSITLDTVDFYVEYFTSPKNKVTLKKEDLYREEIIPEVGPGVVNYYAYILTDNLNPGNLMMRLHADIPDENAPEGVKVEYTECITNVSIYA